MPTGDVNRNELGEFLKARRAELCPSDVGLPDFGRLRRVKGLRREEVAQLASISVDYYTRLEQGRIVASAHVLAAVSRGLRLDEDERTYLYELAGKGPGRSCPRGAETIRPPLRRILDQLTDSPALVLGRRMDILAWNPLAAALLTDFSRIPVDRRNYVRLIFADPQVRRMLADWEREARMTVAFLRMHASEYLDDARLAELVADLSLRDADFREWWATHHVLSATTGTKTYVHTVAGRITVDWEILASTTDPEQHLIVMTAESGSPADQRLRFLASRTPIARGAESKN